MPKNDNASRNFFNREQAKNINKILIGNQRSGTSRDSRGHMESTEMNQNFNIYVIEESATVGFSIVGP